MRYILIIFPLTFLQLNSQDLRESYIDKLKGSWAVYETSEFQASIDPKMDSLYRSINGKGFKETMIENQKEAINERANLLAEILKFFDVEFSDSDSLTIMEQKSLEITNDMGRRRSGVLYIKDSLFGYSYDLNEESLKLEKRNYFALSDNEESDTAKLVIATFIKKGKIDLLDSIAQLESKMLSGPLEGLIPKTEFEIISYNKKGKEKISVIYLHETFLQIMKN
jgi:hypothetical protein